jgi:hypothetical protein
MQGQTWSPELKAAAVATLERETTLNADEGIGEAWGSLARSVAALRDPATIPALVRSNIGSGISRALADFGDLAVRPLTDFANDSEEVTQLTSTLLTLRWMVERTDVTPLSAQSLVTIRQVAESRLSGPESPFVLRRAIDLAVALNDPQLNEIVRSLAADPAAVIARGVSDPAQVQQTQKRAADGLAGTPPGPRY